MSWIEEERGTSVRNMRRKVRAESSKLGFYQEMLSQVRRRTKVKDLPPMDFDAHWVLQQAEKQGHRCCVTGIPFDYTYSRRRHPFWPSLDRIDSDKGYVKGNVRLTCLIYNTALNTDTHADVLRMARALVEVEQVPDGGNN